MDQHSAAMPTDAFDQAITDVDLTAERAAQLIATTPPDLLEWFVAQGLCRYAISGDATGEVVEVIAPPILFVGPDAADGRACPHPDHIGFPIVLPLSAMTLADYHIVLVEWYARAVAAGICRCFVCARPITDDPAAPWDGIFIDKELVAWLIIHFDCKRGLARAFQGRKPFEIIPVPPERFP